MKLAENPPLFVRVRLNSFVDPTIAVPKSKIGELESASSQALRPCLECRESHFV